MARTGKRPLRSGYTTGACAAAAAKAAVRALLGLPAADTVTIPFPDGSRHSFELCRLVPAEATALTTLTALASVVKDAGDDPDVTNGAEIGAEARPGDASAPEQIVLRGGEGVGTATKPGLPVAVGSPAINPVPQSMIRAAVREALIEADRADMPVEISIFIRDGEALAQQTLNPRLGVVGGLSVLGTTGIVRPISAKAWTDTIEASMRVARAAGLDEALLSTGRTSEAAVQSLLGLPEEAQVMMGDYLLYALEAANRHGFARIHLAGMWAKLIKAALAVPQTHVRNGVLETRQAGDLLAELGLDEQTAHSLRRANTAREIYLRLRESGHDALIAAVCQRAARQAEQWSGLPVRVYLVTSEEGVVYVTH
ncbi:MAG: cobalt-precorrin-5B (C(1))-methyltransferase CbiD [Desulfobulbus sp.]|jgi:cobalt-precorrin-5B (C1)-methyltransferase